MGTRRKEELVEISEGDMEDREGIVRDEGW